MYRLSKIEKIMVALLSIVIISAGIFQVINIVNAQTNGSGLTAYYVNATPNLASPGSESFWSSIPAMQVGLIATVTGGGHTKSVSVKMANNGTAIFVLEEWNDTHPSYMESAAIGGNPQILLLKNGTKIVGPNRAQEAKAYQSGDAAGFYSNSTYYYPDRAAIMWFNGNGTSASDVMTIGGPKGPGAGGSLSSGSANIWEWIAGATDNSTNDKGFNFWMNESASGVPYKPTSSFALPLYTNYTNMYQIGNDSMWYSSLPGTSNVNPFNIHVGAQWSNGKWVVEYVRDFAPESGESAYVPTFTTGDTYYFALAVWQGYEGETLLAKSISPSFIPVTISSQSYSTPSSSTPSTSSNGFSGTATMYLILAVILILAISVIIIMTIYKKKPAESKVNPKKESDEEVEKKPDSDKKR